MRKKGLISLSVICLILSHGMVVRGLDEFIDDYENEDYISNTNNIIRNVALDAMELDTYATKLYEDFSAGAGFYIEVDPNAHLIINPNTQWEHDAWRDEDCYLYRDLGVGSVEDFTYELAIRTPTAEDDNSECFYMVLGNAIDDFTALSVGNTIGVSFRDVGGANRLYIWSYDIGVAKADFYVCVLNTWYYLIVTRVDDDIDVEIYSDGARTNLLDTISVVDGVDVAFRYFYATNTRNTGHAIDLANARGANYWLGNYTLSYYANGEYYTTNILDSVNGTTIVLLYNCTLDGSSIMTIEFSSDNSTWVDHNGNAGSDNAVVGYESLDMRDLSYSISCYIRFNFTENNDDTPRVYKNNG